MPVRRRYQRRLFVSFATLGVAVLLQFPLPTDTAEAPVLPFPVVTIEAQPLLVGLPVRLRIPRIGVDAPVIPVGLTETERMEVPVDPGVVGWYVYGARPGNRGSAVLDGHLDLPGSIPGVFWSLRRLGRGDVLEVEDDGGVRRRFRIVRMVEYDVDKAPMRAIFGTGTGTKLNLITCAGIWDQSLAHYNRRLVVFSEMIEPL